MDIGPLIPPTAKAYDLTLYLAEYTIAKRISNEPAFSWLVPTIIRTRLENVPSLALLSKALDLENVNDFWETAIRKELEKVKVAFQLLEENENPSIGSKLINCHIIFDVKMNLTRKARFVAG